MSKHYPWYCESPDMRTNLLLMCKLLFLLLLINGLWGYISDPFIPFIRPLDHFNSIPGLFEWSLKILFLAVGTCLLFNIKVRSMSVALGVIIILFLFASKPRFRNHIFICGCAFLLSGLSDKNQDPWLLYIQLSLVYLGAVLNKVAQLDWWNGQFMHNWLYNARANSFYQFFEGFLPDRWLAKLLSWSSMGIEFFIGVLLLFKKKHLIAVWTIIIFHTVLFTITTFRFGHFFEDILIYLLVFNTWPSGKIKVYTNPKNTLITPLLLGLLNWNKQFKVEAQQMNKRSWIQVNYDKKDFYNQRALGYLLLHTPATFFFLLFFDSAVRLLFTQPAEHLITLFWLWGGIIYFLKIQLTVLKDQRITTTHDDSPLKKSIRAHRN